MKRKYFNSLVYIFCFILLTVFLYKVPLYGDDIANTRIFTHGIDLNEVLRIVSDQYSSWSSRTLVNFVMYFFESTPKVVFCIITGILFCVAVYVIDYFVNYKGKTRVNLLIVALGMLSFPIIYLSTAGWIATVTTYFYPIAILFIGLFLSQINTKSKVAKLTLWIFTFILWLYSFNNEQLAVTVLPVIIVMMFINFKKKREIVYTFSAFLAVILNLIWMLVSPGNKVRNLRQIHDFPAFKELSFINKVDMGFISTFQHYFFGLNLPILIFSFSVLLITINQFPKKKNLLLGVCPLIILLFTNATYYLSRIIGHGKSFFLLNETGFLINLHVFWKAAIMQYLIGIVWLVLVVIWLSRYLVALNEKIFLISLLIGGGASRLMMGFTPSIWVSASRTCTFLTFIFVLISVYLFCNYCSHKQKSLVIIVLSICFIFNVGITYLNFFKGKLLLDLWVFWSYLQNP